MSTSLPVAELLEGVDGSAHLIDSTAEPYERWWLLPRIVTRTVDGKREFFGVCREHRWLSLPAFYVGDVADCPRCADPGFARFERAVSSGLL